MLNLSSKMEVKNKKKLFEYNEESEESLDNNQFNDNEGENILLRNNKKKIKKKLKDYDQIQKDLEKYKGNKISFNDLQKDSEENDQEISEDNEEIENEEENNIKPKILNIDYNKNKEEESEEEKEENEMNLVEEMEKEDKKYLKMLSKVTKDEIRKAKNIINQKELYETFVGIRIALQNLLSDVNSLPSYKNFSEFLKLSSNETKELYKKLKSNINSTFLDTIMNIWYRKTVVNQFQMNNKILKKLSNNDNFCEHILSSVENNMNTLLKKTQKYNNQDNNNQLLGRKRQSAEEYEYDKETFNDSDFYNFLLKEFLLNNEKEIDENNYTEKVDENGLVEGRYDLTMRYILNRNTKLKKNVDTKATKNRKIRYDKHEEIINFMVPQNNDKQINGRNIMINSLFGTKKLNVDLDNNKKEEQEKRETEKLEENDIELI